MAEDEEEEVRVDMTLALDGGGDVVARPLEAPLLVLIDVGALFVVSFALPSFDVAAASSSLSVLSFEEEGVDKPVLSTEGKARPIPRDAMVGEDRATLVLDLPELDEDDEAILLEDTGGKDAALVWAEAAVAAVAAAEAAVAAFAFSFLDKGGVGVATAVEGGGRDAAVIAVAVVVAESASVLVTAVFEPFLPEGGGGFDVVGLAFAVPLLFEPETLLALAWRVSLGGIAEVPEATGVVASFVGLEVAFAACAVPSCSAMEAIEPAE